MNFHTRPERQNVEVQSINRMPAHSPWCNTLSMSLDGIWKFKLCEHPSLLPAGFFLSDFNDSDWKEISVPGCPPGEDTVYEVLKQYIIG